MAFETVIDKKHKENRDEDKERVLRGREKNPGKQTPDLPGEDGFPVVDYPHEQIRGKE